MSQTRRVEDPLPKRGSTPCCLYEAALQALTVPVVIYDHHEFHFLNEECRRLLGGEGNHSADPATLLHEDSRDSSHARSRVVIDQSLAVRGVHVKMLSPKGSVHLVVDEEPVCYGENSAVVQLIREIDSQRIVSYRAKERLGSARADHGSHCIHSAAFDKLPVPVVIQNEDSIVDANHHARLVLSNCAPLRGTSLASVLHPDFVQAGSERRQVVLKQGGHYRGFTAKLVNSEGTPLYIVVDGAPVSYEGSRYAVLVARDVQELPGLL